MANLKKREWEDPKKNKVEDQLGKTLFINGGLVPGSYFHSV
jgi:hypothetical protein